MVLHICLQCVHVSALSTMNKRIIFSFIKRFGSIVCTHTLNHTHTHIEIIDTTSIVFWSFRQCTKPRLRGSFRLRHRLRYKRQQAKKSNIEIKLSIVLCFYIKHLFSIWFPLCVLWQRFCSVDSFVHPSSDGIVAIPLNCNFPSILYLNSSHWMNERRFSIIVCACVSANVSGCLISSVVVVIVVVVFVILRLCRANGSKRVILTCVEHCLHTFSRAQPFIYFILVIYGFTIQIKR